MKISKKGQAATEYLIILAVVIVIALVVVVAMGKFPGIGKSTVSRSSQAYWAARDRTIAITDYTVGAGTTATFTVKNNMKNAITITLFSIGNNFTASNIGTLGSGGSAIVPGAKGIGCPTTCTARQAFSCNVSITYIDVNTNITYSFTGDGTKLEGICAN